MHDNIDMDMRFDEYHEENEEDDVLDGPPQEDDDETIVARSIVLDSLHQQQTQLQQQDDTDVQLAMSAVLYECVQNVLNVNRASLPIDTESLDAFVHQLGIDMNCVKNFGETKKAKIMRQLCSKGILPDSMICNPLSCGASEQSHCSVMDYAVMMNKWSTDFHIDDAAGHALASVHRYSNDIVLQIAILIANCNT